MTAASHIDRDQFRVLLEGTIDELRCSIDAARGAAATVELDQNRQGRLSRMDAMQGQAMAQAGRARQIKQLAAAQDALQRLKRGEFGRCLACDEWIASGRLKLDPTLTYCVVCAASFE